MVIPTIKQTGGVRGIGDESDKKAKLGEFSLSLVKSFFKSGYYAPDHPEAKQAITKLYSDFKEFVLSDSELGYILVAGIEKQDILIDGMGEEAIPFSAVMAPGMAELFTPKFYDYLSRHNLVSISFLGKMEFGEWLSFINAMNASMLVSDITEQHRMLNEAFERDSIRNIKIIFNEDMIRQVRQISWRAKLAISKLNKDISQIPILRDKTERELVEVKKRIFEDILRPLKQAKLMAELLLNSDLVQVSELGTMSVDPLNEFVSIMQADMLLETGRILLGYQKQLQIAKPANISDDEYDRRLRFLPQIIIKLIHRTISEEFENSEKQFAFLEELYHADTIKREQLPKKMLQFLEMKELADKIQQNTEGFIVELANTADLQSFSQKLTEVAKVGEELIRRGDTTLLFKIIKTISATYSRSQNVYISQAIAKVFTGYGSMKFYEFLKGVFLKASKPERELLAVFFRLLGSKSLFALMDVLKESEDMSVRKSARDLIKLYGEDAIIILRDELSAPDVQWFLIRNLIDIVGEIGMLSEGELIAPFLKHEHPKVREASVLAYARVCGELGMEQIVVALSDKVEEVAIAAVKALRMLKCGELSVLVKYAKFLEWKEKAEDAAPDRLQIEVCYALAEIGNVKISGDWSTEDVLLKVLATHDKGLFGKIMGKDEEKPPQILTAALGALGKIGSEKAVDTIKRYQKHKDNNVRSAAENALKSIERLDKAF